MKENIRPTKTTGREKEESVLPRVRCVAALIWEEMVWVRGNETRRQMEEATARIREEKEKAIREVRAEITDLSVAIAEKVLRESLSAEGKQKQMIDKLLDDVSFRKS